MVLPDLVWNQFVDSRAMKWLQQNSPGIQAWVQRPKDFDLKGATDVRTLRWFTNSDALSGRAPYRKLTQA
jgi:hypothetical protein